jgi:hypothetical protein
MQTEQIVLERDKARELWRDYRKHQHWSEPIDREVMRSYQALAQGKVVIQALESIVKAGVGQDGLPRLAIVRADAKHCWLDKQSSWNNNNMVFASTVGSLWQANLTRQRIVMPLNRFPGIKLERRQRAIVPQIPLPLRPKRGLANYHILFEAEWSFIAPKDPLLLRRAGKGDLWIVCAAWELTEIERAALTARIQVN